jgi:sugar fermentation stimulation protein A
VEAASGAVVGIDTGWPNRLAAEALAAGALPALAGYQRVCAEVRYGERSRADFLLEADGRPPCWLEVKGVTLSRAPGLAEWPDCVSARGARHMNELAARARAGDRAAVLFVAMRADCDRFAVADDLDPAFAQALARAREAGVEAFAVGCRLSPEGVGIDRALLPHSPAG